MQRLIPALAIVALFMGCGDPQATSFRLSEVELFGDTGTSRLRFVILPLDASGEVMRVEGQSTARIVEGGDEVCSFTLGSYPRVFDEGLPYEELFTAPCPPPTADGPPREIEVTLVQGDSRLTERVPIPADAVWISAEAVAADRAGREAASVAREEELERRRNTTTSDVARQQFGEYVESIRRAVAAVPEAGTGGASACLMAPAGQAPPQDLDSAPFGRVVFEPWARAIAATPDSSQLPSASDSKEPGAFINSNLVSTATAMLAQLARDPAAFADDESRLGRVMQSLANDGSLLLVVRVNRVVEPVVVPADDLHYRFTPGSVDAIVFAVDRESGSLLCASNASATNSSTVALGPVTDARGTEEAFEIVLADLKQRATEEFGRVRTDQRPQ